MDLPRPAALKQLRLTVSAEGTQFAYYISDLTNGKILSVSRSIAQAFMLLEQAVLGNARAKEALTEDQVRDGMKVVTYLRSVRDSERLAQKKLNPVSIQFKFFDVGQFQPALQGFANWFIGLPFALLFGGLLLLAFLIGTQNNWAIWVEFQGIFNLQALLTFGLIAPFLKVIHEFGHVLVATRFNVRVRQAGMNLIGLYPLPYVDCTEADLTARRRDRIWISLAGILTDFTIALIAFLVWHLAESDAVQDVAGRVFAFSTVSSVLFNANPLMKFDGYYTMVDLIGQRNLYTRASKGFKDFRSYLVSFGASGARPQRGGDWAVLGYGLATFLYRIVILYTIMVTLMPQYLGLGMVISVWGAYAMFLSPLMMEKTQKTQKTQSAARPTARIWAGRIIFAVLIGLFIAFVRLPFVQVVPLSLDQRGFYDLSAPVEGVVAQSPASAATVQAGDQILQLDNPGLMRERGLLELELQEAELFISTAAGVSAAQSQAAEEKLTSVQDRLASVDTRIAGLVVRAQATGLFVPPQRPLEQGAYVQSGQSIGALYPATGEAQLAGAFPERLVETYQDTEIAFTLYTQEGYAPVEASRVRLVESTSIDQSSGTLSFKLQVTAPTPAAALVGDDVQIRLDFGSRPVWEHLRFWWSGQIAAFRDAQLADQSRRVGGG